MFPALMLSATLIAAEPAASPTACAAVQEMKAKYTHGALLYFGDALAGAVYATSSGAVYYQSQGKFGDTVSDASRQRAMSVLGITSASSSATPVMAPKPSFAAVLAPDVRIKGCF